MSISTSSLSVDTSNERCLFFTEISSDCDSRWLTHAFFFCRHLLAATRFRSRKRLRFSSSSRPSSSDSSGRDDALETVDDRRLFDLRAEGRLLEEDVLRSAFGSSRELSPGGVTCCVVSHD